MGKDSYANDPAKKLWRQKIVEFAGKYFSPNQLRNARVLCLPGPEMLEVFEVYDKLGVKRKNIVGLENDAESFEELEARNNSLENRIHVVNRDVFDFTFRDNSRGYDIISLDYTGYITEDKAQVLINLALKKALAARAIFITNYLMRRESAQIQTQLRKEKFFEDSAKDFTHQKTQDIARYLLENQDTMCDETDLGGLRENSIQKSAVAAFLSGSGFWHTPLFELFMKTQNEELRNRFAKAMSDNWGNLRKEDQYLMMRNFESEADPFFGKLMQYLILKQTSFHLEEGHKAYKYISNSGGPMISDFYFFVKGDNRIPKWMEKAINPAIKNGKFVFNISAGRFSQANMMERIFSEALEFLEGVWTKYGEKVFQEYPQERIELIPECKQKSNGLERKVESPRRKLREYDKNQLYWDLSEGKLTDEEILQKYGLTTMQLAGYKATRTRMNGKGDSEKGNGACGISISQEDEKIIKQFIDEGYKAPEIASLFENDGGELKYNWQAIAALKASKTKSENGNGVSHEGEAYFQRVLKPYALERDNYECQWCGKTDEKNKEDSGHGLHVHHINLNHGDNRRENIATLCTPCHVKSNTMQHGHQIQEGLRCLIEQIEAEDKPKNLDAELVEAI